jgi:hypothetical protein
VLPVNQSVIYFDKAVPMKHKLQETCTKPTKSDAHARLSTAFISIRFSETGYDLRTGLFLQMRLRATVHFRCAGTIMERLFTSILTAEFFQSSVRPLTEETVLFSAQPSKVTDVIVGTNIIRDNWTNFCEIWNGRYGIGTNSKPVHFPFSQSVTLS